MPKVETRVWIDAPLDVTLSVAHDNAAFPEFMDDVVSLDVVEREGEGPEFRVVSDWVGVVPTFGLKLKWKQEDVWTEGGKVCTFRQLEGDYDELTGVWRFEPENGGTSFVSELDYEYKVPGLGPLVGKVIYKLVVKNMDGVAAAIKARSESKREVG